MIRIAMMALIAALVAALAGPVSAQPAATDADRNMTVARYYAGRGDHTGAIHRINLVLTHAPSSGHIEEALARLTEEYLAVGVTREAQTAAAVVARKFPGSPWAVHALGALKAAGLAPIEDEGSWLSRMFR
jgi:outer membrane protein assembly factor BamD